MITDMEWLFRQLDSYVRAHYGCFVAELFPSGHEAEYIICFRPTDTVRGLPSEQSSCRYVRVAAADVEAAHDEDRLTDTITAKLAELKALGT